MAYTSLSDVIVPEVFAQYLAEQVSVKSALIASGAIVTNDMLNRYAASAGDDVSIPHFSEFAWVAPDLAKADSTASSPAALGAAKQVAQKDYLSKTWGTTALTNTVTGEDILGHVAGNVAAPYWAQTIQAYALAKLSGVIKDNDANDSDDMIHNVATDSASDDATVGASTFNIDNFVDARQSMGDAADRLKVIVMHSRVYSNLLKLEPTNCDRKSATVPFDTYMGHIVLIDDSMPAVAGTNRTTYTSYLLGQGALLMGEATPEFGAVSVVRNEDEGNGFGAEKLISRKQMILHPNGFSSSATVASGFASPTTTAYDAAAAWNRVMARKNCPIVAFKTNG